MIFDDLALGLFFIFFLIPLIGGIVFLAIFIPIRVVNNKYNKFVLAHSVALRNLKSINSIFKFHRIGNHDLTNKYDNNDFYPTISCTDYLIYNLADYKKQQEVEKAIDCAAENKEKYKNYQTRINNIRKYGVFDVDRGKLKIEKLIRKETSYFYNFTLKPITDFSINVKLIRTNINGDYQQSKTQHFISGTILNLIDRINNKDGKFYLDDDVWASICRVERGKVSNKMRFFILDRDHHRCKMCGSTRNLEIDHIIPIAKGGKSTPNNLQVLCHKCNKKKGADIY